MKTNKPTFRHIALKKHIPISLFLGVGLAFLAGCSGFRELSAPTAAAAAPGTQVEFARVMNPTLAEGYIGADIVTEAEFFAPNANQYWQVNVPNGYMVMQVVIPGVTPQANPLSGASVGDYVFVPTSYADTVFALRRGDRVELRGGTVVTKQSALAGLSGARVTLVQFKAKSVTKVR